MYYLRLVVTVSLLTWLQSAAAGLEQRSRHPVALTVSNDYEWLYVANRNSGSMSVIDTTHGLVANEIEIGGRLSDLAALPDRRCLLVLDEQNHQLVLLVGEGVDWEIASRLNVAQFPVRLQVECETGRCYVSCLWSQMVTVVEVSTGEQGRRPRLRIAKELRLPFEPREMCLAATRKKLIVAGSFGGVLAVIDTESLELVAVEKLPGHNIRGLAISGDGERLLASQQELNPLARSSFDDVHWGNMISNMLVSFSLDDICDPAADALSRRVPFQLGQPGNAAADPGPIDVASNGVITVVFSGVNEVAIGSEDVDYAFRRIPVGRRPSAVVSTRDGRIFVADTFSDSISIVDVVNAKKVDQVSLGPRPDLSLVERGEMLFFDGRISHDGWMSCHSCHTDGHSNGQLNDNLSDGSFDAPKRVLSLLGVGQTGPWAWNGSVETLEEQVTNSIQKTMQGERPTNEQIAALVAYLETLAAPPLLANLAAGRNGAGIHQGEELFRSLDCQRCHAPPTYTSPHSYDVGLTDSVGNKEFNPPSLRGAGRRHAFFHDARVTSLDDVFASHKHQLPRALSTSELASLIHFLKSI